jgi:hypothetical protein
VIEEFVQVQISIDCAFVILLVEFPSAALLIEFKRNGIEALKAE